MPTPEFTITDAKRFDISAQRALGVAIYLGWRVRWSNSSKRLAIMSYGHKKINVPTTNINANRAQSWLNQILRESDPVEVMKLATGGIDDLTKMTPDQQSVVALIGTLLVDVARQHIEKKGEVMQPLTHSVGESAPKPQPPAQTVKAVTAQVEEKVTAPTPDVQMSVKRRYPYTAARGGNRANYPSDIIEVVEFDNGVTIFGCKRCEYMNANPGSVRAHSVQAHRGQGSPVTKAVEKPKPEPVSEPVPEVSPQPVAPMSVGLPLLTKVISDQKKRDVSARDMAVGIINQSWEVRCHLAMLLLNGTQFEQLRTGAEQAIEEAQADAERWKELAGVYQEQASKAASDLATLKDLVSGLGER